MTFPPDWPCLHCGVPVVFDDDGRPVHYDGSYSCRGPGGVITSTTAELPRAIGRASVKPLAADE